MENKIDYIKSSISDIQNTIRAIDTKIIALLFMTIIPITQIKVIFYSLSLIIQKNEYLAFLFLIILIISWLSSLTFSFLTLIGIKNPRKNIPDSIDFKGIYFGDKLYTIKFKNLFETKGLISKLEVSEHAEQFDKKKQKLAKELVYEQMKLALIRDVKFFRHKAAFISLYVLIMIIAIIIVFGQILVNNG